VCFCFKAALLVSLHKQMWRTCAGEGRLFDEEGCRFRTDSLLEKKVVGLERGALHDGKASSGDKCHMDMSRNCSRMGRCLLHRNAGASVGILCIHGMALGAC